MLNVSMMGFRECSPFQEHGRAKNEQLKVELNRGVRGLWGLPGINAIGFSQAPEGNS